MVITKNHGYNKLLCPGMDTASIEKMAVMFADRVPEMKYSPAEILSFLIPYKRSPQDAVDNIITWVERGEGSVPLPRHTSTMNTMDEDTGANCVSASLDMDHMEDVQWFTLEL